MATSYRQDILDQPSALRDTLDAIEADGAFARHVTGLMHRGVDRVVLTGMGSSLHALYPLYLRLSAARRPCWLIETSELIHYGSDLLAEGTLVVAVSQSGASAEIARLAERWSNRLPIIAVTNSAASPLAVSAAAALVTKAGDEAAVSSKTYVAALVALCRVGDLMLEEREPWFARVADVPDRIAGYLAACASHVQRLTEELRGIGHLFLVGRGISLAAVNTGALILKESTRVPAEGMSSAGFRHGPFEMVSKRAMVVVCEGEARPRDLNLALARDVAAVGGRSLLVGPRAALDACRLPDGGAPTLPFLELLPMQMMSLALGSLGGFESGVFERATKVTTVE